MSSAHIPHPRCPYCGWAMKPAKTRSSIEPIHATVAITCVTLAIDVEYNTVSLFCAALIFIFAGITMCGTRKHVLRCDNCGGTHDMGL